MKKNILLTIEYDGSMFTDGRNSRTRRQCRDILEETISSALRRKSGELNGTSRTDAGVHALGRGRLFIDVNIPVEKFPLIINNAFERRRKIPLRCPP